MTFLTNVQSFLNRFVCSSLIPPPPRAAEEKNRIAIVWGHPRFDSYSAALLARAKAGLAKAGHEVQQIDLYHEAPGAKLGPFECALSSYEHEGYYDPSTIPADIQEHLKILKWADKVLFIYPTWWFGPPAMVKGWMDRVLRMGETFDLPGKSTPSTNPASTAASGLIPMLTHIKKIGLITTYGAPKWYFLVYSGDYSRKIVSRVFAPACVGFPELLILWMINLDLSDMKARETFLQKVEASCEHF
ncbi:unnamed protein product [Vitrella brassicaformis CCMP3155]|uniref:Flavodoxin-like fold domain-containing protein n=2 Tax=Vitrella brassicaformis TaxID=1169539 RepID=A0A0G4ET09_VITBC|nr:unnamed protein product [Vitrella brassicaformis CCMP3155]|mmetsp:Transcript_24814/g.61345  ORF Transcript_24814/g.61345 Transcript_24814/m.61345 type:complete len:245 (+) Transcript_24814:776-1510(+)|eukprot:CEM01551.1 unnamed protein product [Vitrella brassicaformis CCMP3155]